MTNHATGETDAAGAGAGAGTDPPRHPIGVVSTRTGLSADVIRVWERRYGVVEPARDDSQRRLYSDEDVEHLLLLARATAAGRGIGQVAELGVEELRELVHADEVARWSVSRGAVAAGGASPAEASVERAMERVASLDGPGLEGELGRAAMLLGLTPFLERVVAPLFRRIGEDWHAGRLGVAQEHLASEVTGSLLARLMAALSGSAGAPLVVVATPAGEQHAIGALLVAAVASAAGWRVGYLGSNVPSDDIAGAARALDARAVALSVVYGDAGARSAEVTAVRAGLPAGVELLVGGAAATALGPVAGVRYLEDLESLRSYLVDRV